MLNGVKGWWNTSVAAAQSESFSDRIMRGLQGLNPEVGVGVTASIKAIEGIVGVESAAAKEAGSIWSASKSKSAVENALGHWNKRKGEFPELANSKQYVEAAYSLAAKPPADALIKSRGADTLIYDKASNTFLVRGPMVHRARCLGRRTALTISTGNEDVQQRSVASLPVLRVRHDWQGGRLRCL